MNNLNSILLEGNMVRDPLFRSTPKGTPVCNFTIASNRFFKQDTGLEREVSFFDVETWAKLAERCFNMGRKGRGVRVVGRLKQERWNGPDGKIKTRITIVAEHVEFRPDFKKEGDAVKPGEGAMETLTATEDASALPASEPLVEIMEGLEPVTF
jgi:single-strand DNA-binding protein